jgi:hypothetical protein
MKYILIIFILNCNQFEKKIFKTSNCNSKLPPNKSRIVVSFRGEDNFILKDVKIRISKNLPKLEYYNRYSIRKFIFIPWITIDKTPDEPRINSNIEFEILTELQNSKQICIDIQPNEYFASIENIESDSFSFNPMESKLILFTFGYGFYLKREYKKEHKEAIFIENQFLSMDISDFDEEYCIFGRNKYYWDGDRTSKEIAECPKLKLEKEKIYLVDIQLGKREFNSNGEFLFTKLVPGLIFLAPITNSLGYFYKRNYKINLTKKSINSNDPSPN